jgi:hypothetical protein
VSTTISSGNVTTILSEKAVGQPCPNAKVQVISHDVVICCENPKHMCDIEQTTNKVLHFNILTSSSGRRLNSCSSVFCNRLSLRTIYLCESHLVCRYICRDSYESATLVRTSRFVVHFCPCNLQLHSLYQTQIWYLQTRTSLPHTLVWVFFFVHSLSLPYNLQFQHLYQNTNLKLIYVCLFVNMPPCKTTHCAVGCY